MKVLQINTVYKQGSTGNIVANLHSLIQKKGNKSFVGFGRGNWDEQSIIKVGSNIDMYTHGIGTRIFDKHGLYSTKSTKEFIKQIDKLDIDIFHLHNIHGYYLNYKILFKYLKQTNKPVIWTLHDCWSFTGHCSYYDYIGCDRWQSGCHDCPQKKMYPASFIFDNSKNNFLLKQQLFTSIKNMTIVTPSRWLAVEVRKSFLNKYNVKVIHNGIDLEIFKPITNTFRKKIFLKNKFLILGVANIWEERKGFDYFLKLAKVLKNDEYIVLVGLNDHQIKQLPSNIFGIKRTNNLKELVEIYNSADVFINPTLEDNFPTTNLESLACGTPVITFDSGGSPETIDDTCGAIVEKGDLNALYEAIQKMKNYPVKTQDCVTRAINYFNKENRFEEYIELYKKASIT